jgi:hypothetical protein
MKIKPNRPLQIAALAFALTVLATYVVYSQLQRARTPAPVSTSAATNVVKRSSIGGPSTNHLEERRTTLVAPGSKAMAPVLDMRPEKASRAAPAPTSVSLPAVFAPGSKSAPVFNLRQPQQSQKLKETTINSEARRATNTTAKAHP